MKQLVLSVFSFVLVFQIFFGTTGVIVYEHHCKKDGTSRSFFGTIEHEVQELQSCSKSACCKSSKITSDDFPFIQQPPCCTSSTEYVQFDADLAMDNNSVQSAVANVSGDLAEKVADVFKPVDAFHTYRGPPVLTISHRLANLQLYLI